MIDMTENKKNRGQVRIKPEIYRRIAHAAVDAEVSNGEMVERAWAHYEKSGAADQNASTGTDPSKIGASVPQNRVQNTVHGAGHGVSESNSEQAGSFEAASKRDLARAAAARRKVDKALEGDKRGGKQA